MTNKDDIFFEVLLRNSKLIMQAAAENKDMQHTRLLQLKSRDITADAALDNIAGGRMCIDIKGRLIRVSNVDAWANVINAAAKHFTEKDEMYQKVWQLCYMEARTNHDALKIMRCSRAKFFAAKYEIKNFVRAAACQIGLSKVF